ncbi:CehA/McbA family metallohydrolase [soil metagenome]
MRFARRFTPEDRAAGPYQYLEAEVPHDVDGFTVSLDYDRAHGVIDLGLVGPDRFAGWSGGARYVVAMSRTWATPGYLPGPLAGRWQIVLGLHRVAAAGVDVKVKIELGGPERPVQTPSPAPGERPPRHDLPASDGRRWRAGDFHAHTVHSDGALGLAELAERAARRGLEVLAVTDHNTVSHHRHLATAGDHAGIALVPGQEVTTDRGHANVFGDVGWIDFRQPPDTWGQEADRRGGLLCVNHPWRGELAWRYPGSAPAEVVEMWHSTWDRRSPVPWETFTRFGSVPIGGSDFHRPGSQEVGSPTTWLECEDTSTASVLAALRSGRVAISADPQGPVLIRHGDELVAVAAAGCRLVLADGEERPVARDRWRIVADGPGRLVDTSGVTVALCP